MSCEINAPWKTSFREKALKMILRRKELSIDLHGDLAGILKIASEDKSMKNLRLETRKLERKAINDNFLFARPFIQLVAGVTGFEPVTFGL